MTKCEQPVNSVHIRLSINLFGEIREVSQDVMNVSVDEWRSLKRRVDVNEFALDIPSTQCDSALGSLGDANDLCNIINACGSSMGIGPSFVKIDHDLFCGQLMID